MKTPLAWKNLTHNKVRTAVALAGVGFAITATQRLTFEFTLIEARRPPATPAP